MYFMFGKIVFSPRVFKTYVSFLELMATLCDSFQLGASFSHYTFCFLASAFVSVRLSTAKALGIIFLLYFDVIFCFTMAPLKTTQSLHSFKRYSYSLHLLLLTYLRCGVRTSKSPLQS